jgi:phage-related protein (TIGR01555 family)
VLHFKGCEIPKRLQLALGTYRNQSIIETIFLELGLYLNATKATSASLTRSSVFVYKMRGFAKRIAKLADIAERFSLLNSTLSVLKGIVIDAESEEVEYVTQSLQGYKELLDKFEDQLVAVSGYPRSKLLGSSNSTAFSEAGLSDRLEWAQLLNNYQVSHWLPLLTKLCNLITPPEINLLIEFESSLILSDLETAQLAKLRAETDAIYLSNLVQTPEEVKIARFGGATNTSIGQEN